MSITWSSTTTGAETPSGTALVSRKAVCTTGTETFAQAATDGASLKNAGAWDVVIEADSGQTLSGAGTVQAWIYDDTVAGWCRAPEFDVTVPAGVASIRRYYPLAGSPGKGIPVITQRGRIGYTVSGVTISSGGVTIYINLYAGAVIGAD